MSRLVVHIEEEVSITLRIGQPYSFARPLRARVRDMASRIESWSGFESDGQPVAPADPPANTDPYMTDDIGDTMAEGTLLRAPWIFEKLEAAVRARES